MPQIERAKLVRALTLSRLIVGLLLPLAGLLQWWGVAATVFLAAYATDLLDGALARRWGVCSASGKRLDTVADVTLTLGGMLAAVLGGRWPGWFLAAVVIASVICVWGEPYLRGDLRGAVALGMPFMNFALTALLAVTFVWQSWHTDGMSLGVYTFVVIGIVCIVKRNHILDYISETLEQIED